MKRIKYITLLLCMAFSLEGIAQTAKSAYFLDGTFHNSRLNPAMQAERSFISLGIGNISIGTNGNVGLSHFIYPKDDHLTTFMSGTVNQDEFINRLPERIRLGTNFDATLLGFGFRMLGGYTTFSVSTHSNTSMSLPKGFFEIAKRGIQEQHYSLSAINMNTMNYAAATLGYSREVYKGLSVGVNLKYLMGLAYTDVTFDKFNAEFSDERWMIEGHTQAQAALFSEVYFEDEGQTLGDLQMGSLSPRANGFAVDLGVVYDMKDFVPGLTLSASVIDLGLINWKYMMSIQDNGSPIVWEGVKDADINDLEGALEEEMDKVFDKAGNVAEFEVNDIKSGATNLKATMYLGAEYNMPFYKPLSAALLYSKKFSPYSGWDEVRGYVNIAPLKWFEASANVGYSTFGTTWGWMLNFHPTGVNLFVGSDYMITKVNPQFIPINNFNNHITLGMNIVFGKRK